MSHSASRSSVVKRAAFMRGWLLFFALFAAACGNAAASSPPKGGTCTVGSQMIETDLYFGFDRKGMAPVSEGEWQDFLDTVVSRLFDAGLTVLDANGQYLQMKGGIVREHSKMVILLHEGGDKPLRHIETIRSTYKQRFAQEAVLRVDLPVCISF
jgi:hypothetical protein